MTRFLRLLLLSLLGAASASAVPVIASSTGLTSSSLTLDFTNPPPTTGANGSGAAAGTNGSFDLATYQNLGVTFSVVDGELRYNPNGSSFFNAGATGIAGDYLGNYQSDLSGFAGFGTSFVNIGFTTLVQSAALAIHKDRFGNSGSLFLNALRGGAIVETFALVGGTNGGFYGFENVAGGFDTLQIGNSGGTFPGFFRMDNLQVAVPELDLRLSTLPCLFSLMLLAVVRGAPAQAEQYQEADG